MTENQKVFVKNRVAEDLVAKFDFVENSAIRTIVFTTGRCNTKRNRAVFGEFCGVWRGVENVSEPHQFNKKTRTTETPRVFVPFRLIIRFFVSSVAEATVSLYGRFPQSPRSLGTTNHTGGSGGLYGLTLFKQMNTRATLLLRMCVLRSYSN